MHITVETNISNSEIKKKKGSEQRGVITDLNNFALHEAFPSAEVTGLKCHVDFNIDSTMF